MPKVKINDINMYYEIHGEGEPIIFVGGFGTDHTVWNSIVNLFKTDYQVIVFDNRGAGQTDVPETPYTIEQMADDVAELCRQLGVTKAHFVGSSMGGYIVQTIAYRYSALTKSITITNSVMFSHTCFRLFSKVQGELMQQGVPLELLVKGALCWVYSINFLSQEGMIDRLVQLKKENPYPFTLAGQLGQLAASDQFDSRTWAADITVPALVVAADQDIIFREPIIRELAETIPNAKYHIFQNCGHVPHIEYPEQFSAMLKSFIKN